MADDLQELDRLRGEASKSTISPMVARDAADSRTPGPPRASQDRAKERADGRTLPNDRAIDSQMRVVEAVIRRTLFDNRKAVTRMMSVAKAHLDAHVAAGRTVQPAMVRTGGQTMERRRRAFPCSSVRPARSTRSRSQAA